MISQDRFFIGGEWVKPAGSGFVDVISPITEEAFGRLPESTTADIDRAVAAARLAFDEGDWPRMSIAERGEFLIRMAELLEPEFDRAVDLQIDEMGGTGRFLRAWTEGITRAVPAMVAMAQALPTREIRDGIAGKIAVLREPIGVVGAIIPWNCPFLFVMTKLLPAVLTGCPVIVKPAPETPLDGYIIAEALARAGLPKGVVSIVPGGREVGEHLVSHRGVDKVTFTGSTVAGRRIASICGDQIKPVTLELGGKSAAIVLEDADLDRHLPTLLGSAMLNTGQACVATTRILAPASRYGEVVDRLVSALSGMKIGNPHEEDTVFGPLVAERQRTRVEGYIKAGIDEGAKIAYGGGRPNIQKGWFVEPTIFTEVDNAMRIAQEEIFGPVAVVIRYDTPEQAIAIANDSAYGLGGGVYTSDIAQGMAIAGQIRTGTFTINDAPIGGGGGPSGGYKQSGIGREFNLEGFDAHYYLKSISFPPGVSPPEA
jgi:aldehyde dehydrogenase (NAD+)